jgi:hypothetical protein
MKQRRFLHVEIRISGGRLNGERAIRTQKGATILKEPCAGGLVPKCFSISIVKKESKTCQKNLKSSWQTLAPETAARRGSLASSVTME